MICAYCGNTLPENATVCDGCGRAVLHDLVEPRREPAEGIRTALIAETISDAFAESEAPTSGPDSGVVDHPSVWPALAPKYAPPGVEDVADMVNAVGGEPDLCAQCGSQLGDTDIFCGECGFVRTAASTAAPAATPMAAAERAPGFDGDQRPGDTTAFDPFPWGLPRSTEALSAVPEFVPVHDDDIAAGHIDGDSGASYIDGDIEATKIVDRSARGNRFVLQFSTGENVTVTGTGLVGRNPVSQPGEYFDSFVAIADPGKSVSKTHLEFGQDAGVFWVSDRFSANGTVLREPEQPPRRSDAGKRYRVVRGTRVDIGEQFFIIS